MNTTASPLAIAHAYACGIASSIRSPFAGIRERDLRAKAAYNARVAGDNAQHFLCLGFALNTDHFVDTAGRFARRAWHEATVALEGEAQP